MSVDFYFLTMLVHDSGVVHEYMTQRRRQVLFITSFWREFRNLLLDQVFQPSEIKCWHLKNDEAKKPGGNWFSWVFFIYIYIYLSLPFLTFVGFFFCGFCRSQKEPELWASFYLCYSRHVGPKDRSVLQVNNSSLLYLVEFLSTESNFNVRGTRNIGGWSTLSHKTAPVSGRSSVFTNTWSALTQQFDPCY